MAPSAAAIPPTDAMSNLSLNNNAPPPRPASADLAPEFTAVILAATCGARLFPITRTNEAQDIDMTDVNDDDDDEFSDDEKDNKQQKKEEKPTEKDNSTTSTGQAQNDDISTTQKAVKAYMPKHLLPLAGTAILQHLLNHLTTIGFTLSIIAISHEDTVTIPFLKSNLPGCVCHKTTTTSDDENVDGVVQSLYWKGLQMRIVTLPSHCSSSNGGGSAEALRYIDKLQYDYTTGKPINMPVPTEHEQKQQQEEEKQRGDGVISVLPRNSHVMILPADLILYGNLVNNDEKEGQGQQGKNNKKKEEDALGSLADAHRAACLSSSPLLARHTYGSDIPTSRPLPPPTALTMLLTDVGEVDDHGIPLKESHKMKKGGIAREDEDIEYIALSPINTSTTSLSSSQRKQQQSSSPQQRIIFKQSKYNVELDVADTGATPKLTIPKSRLMNPMMTVRLDWSDVHVFVLSPWTLKLLHARVNVKDLNKEFIPLLVTRQFQGIKSAFGLHDPRKKNSNSLKKTKKRLEEDILGLLRQVLMEDGYFFSLPPVDHEMDDDDNTKEVDNTSFFYGKADEEEDDTRGGHNSSTITTDDSPSPQDFSVDYPFIVAAKVLSHTSSKLSLRACTIPAYLYTSREIIHQTLGSASTYASSSIADKNKQKSKILLPQDTTVNSKFNSIMMKDASMGNKVNVNSSTIGSRSKIGNRCRLNNVIVMDDVTIGDNCVLQNSILASGSIVGDNCNLNDCHVESKFEVVAGTKGKGESYHG